MKIIVVYYATFLKNGVVLQIIGALEKVSLPELELFDLDAKVDTGADSSALHCDHIEVNDGYVSFHLCDEVHPSYNGKSFTLPVAKVKNVKSSNGSSSQRVFVETVVAVGVVSRKTRISLTDRSDLKHPMLLGKRYLSGNFLVDVSQSYIGMEQ